MISSKDRSKGLLSLLFIIIAHLAGAKADFFAFIQQEVRLALGSVNPLGFHIQEPLQPGPIPSRPHSELERDGGGQPWRLFNGDAPKLSKGKVRPGDEAYVPADPTDTKAKKCFPGDENGYWYYNVSTPVIVPFILAENDKTRTDATVLVIPGGGMRFLAWQKEGTHLAKFLNSIGINAFVVKYRVPAYTELEFSDSMVDIQRAFSLVRSQAETLRLNSSRIGVMGFSAGGILAARASTGKKLYTVNDKVDSMSHLPDFAILISAFGDPSTANAAPPTFMAIAHDDQCVSASNVESYYFALQDTRHVGHELHVFAEGRHGYGDCSMYVEGMQWRDVCAWTMLVKVYLKTQIFKIHDTITGNTMNAVIGEGNLRTLLGRRRAFWD